MLNWLKSKITILVFELAANGILPIGVFAAIDRTATGECRQLSNGYTKELLCEDVVSTFMDVRNLTFQTNHQSLGYFTKKNTTLANRVEELGLFTTEKFCR
jgi:hypothetical protein